MIAANFYIFDLTIILFFICLQKIFVRKALSEALQALLPGSSFRSVEQLIEGLKHAKSDAISYVLSKAGGEVRSLVRKAGQPRELAADLLHDGLLILIEKIKDGTFDASKSSPQTYLKGICYKLLSNRLRLKQPPPVDSIDNSEDFTSDDLRNFLDQKHRIELIELLLKELGPPGNDLIRLKYLEGYSDEEQIKKDMTPYKTLDSLKASRHQYFKKLAVMAKKWKEEYHAS